MEMERQHNLGSSPFVEAVLEHSSVFEHLGHSKAFEQVLLDNLIERTDELTIDEISVPKEFVPEDIIITHGWPSRFSVKDLKASLISFPKTKNCEEDWLFNADYSVDYKKYYMRATNNFVTTNYYDSNGGRHEQVLDSGMGMQFVRTLALGLSHEQGHEFPADKMPLVTPENEEVLRGLLRMMGSMKGEYKSEISSYIKGSPNSNRGIVVHHKENESPTESGLNIDYAMVWEIADGKSTKITSHQEEVIDSAIEGINWSVRYTERRPTEAEPDNLPYSLVELDDDGTEKATFMQDCDSILYEIANTSIMTTIVPHMRKYLHLDEDTPTEIFEYRSPQDLVD